MSDLANWKVHGPVATLRTETAEWDADREDWKPARFFTVISFRLDGSITAMETHNPGGSISHSRWLYDSSGRLTESDSRMNDDPAKRILYFYDEAGRHTRTAELRADGSQTDLEISTYDGDGQETKTRFLPVTEQQSAGSGAVSIGYSIEGTDMMLGAPGAASMATTYAAAGRPAKVILEDANHKPLRDVRFTRDASGRPLKIETLIGESTFTDMADRISPDAREQAAGILRQIFGEAFSSTAYTYDSQGRVSEQTERMGTMSEGHTSYRYDDHHEEPIEEITETRRREANLDENGAIRYKHDTVSIQHTRFEYRYDEHDNWIERIVSTQFDPNADSRRSNIERRTITYYS